MTFPFQTVLGYQLQLAQVFSSCWQVQSLREWNELKTYNCIVFTVFEHTKLYPFQNLCLGFILKIFFNFRKFQPLYSYKIYFYRKRLWSFKNLYSVLVYQCALVKVIQWLQRRLLYWQKKKENFKKIQKDRSVQSYTLYLLLSFR